MKVAIILINWKTYAERFLPACAASLRLVTFPEGEFIVFVVDNETSPETQAYIKQVMPECVLLTNETNVGFAAGNNTGLAAAFTQGFDYCCVLNMDTEVEPDFLSKAVVAYQSAPNMGLVQSRLMLFDDKTKINSIGNVVHFLGFGYSKGYKDTYTPRPTTEEIIYPSGAAVLVSKAVWEKIGGFTEEFFMYHEDLEWGLKSRLAGYTNILANESVVYHKYDFSRSVSKYFWMERNRYIVNVVILKWPTLLLISLPGLFVELASMVFAVKGGWWKNKLKAWGWFFSLRNWKTVLQWRKGAQALRTITDRTLMRDFVATIEYQEVGGDSWIMSKVANPGLSLIWKCIYFLIRW